MCDLFFFSLCAPPKFNNVKFNNIAVVSRARPRIACEACAHKNISNSEFLSRIYRCLAVPRSFPPRVPPWRYRGRSFNLKTAFHARKTTRQSGIEHSPFFLSFRDSLHPAPHPLDSTYIHAVPPFVFIRAIGKGGSFESLFIFSRVFTA